MDHIFHVFIPGTPENTALASLFPALAPMYNQLVWATCNVFRSLRAKFQRSV